MSKIRVYILSITAKFILSKYIIEYNPNNDRLLTNTNQFACRLPIVFGLTAFCITRLCTGHSSTTNLRILFTLISAKTFTNTFLSVNIAFSFCIWYNGLINEMKSIGLKNNPRQSVQDFNGGLFIFPQRTADINRRLVTVSYRCRTICKSD